MNHYLQDIPEVFSSVNSSAAGLSNAEATKRLETNGKNRLKEAEKQSIISRFFGQMKDPMTLILIAAAVVSAITAVADEHHGFTDVFIIMAVVIINACLGVYQESKAEKAIEALQKMSASTSKVLRDGNIQQVKSEDLVVGDIIILESGDSVPADARIIESASLTIEEAALTGESVPVNKFIDILNLSSGAKDVPLGDRKNMVYMGSTIVYGRGSAVITSVGMSTEMGKIADALSKAEEGQTPLQLKLAQLSHILSYLVIGICIFIFGFSLIRSGNFDAETILSTFMVAISLAVAAIPEGLATVVTIVLSIGVTNMSKKNAVIRKLTAVETLGCAQIICSDKTGTLTQNKMTVVKHFSDDEKFLASSMALCSDAEVETETSATGEPTECALVNYASSLKLNKNELKKDMPRIGEAPFDSVRKMMSTVHKTSNGDIVQYTKGAPDEILKVCSTIWRNGKAEPLTDAIRTEILTANKGMADEALRVLCGAFKNHTSAPADFSPDTLETELTFIGLTGLIDPVRPEVLPAIEKCRAAGIKPIMITGDHRDTAVAIAKQLTIISDASEAITGAELNEISDEDFFTQIEKYSVYARVQPEHKVRIVNTWKAKGMITAMTGDGVNDAPSIKSSDIGIGMGITGTDVTKNVADMVLADDNFATIVSAVEEGRRIYDNIRKAIHFLLSTNLSEVLAIFFATLMGFVILEPIHLLWINLVTDCFPALALGMEKGEKDIMQRQPRSSRDSILADGMVVDIVYQGIIITILTVSAFFIGHYLESGKWEIVARSGEGTTMAFLTLSMIEVFQSFTLRSRTKSIFTSATGQNVFLIAGAVVSFILTTAVIYVPFLNSAFRFAPITLLEYTISIGLAMSIVPIIEIIKFIKNSVKK
jgi:ATPase, P-type (transporting), HAD superfamily, subfamily IC